MSNIETTVIQASIPSETRLKVLAFNYARNGSFHNSVAELLEAGLKAKMGAAAPESFRERYESHLAAMRTGDVRRIMPTYLKAE